MAAKKPTKKMLPEFQFRVNVRYDSEFRSRDANQRLRRAHPKVKKINVGHRDTAKQSRDGNSYVTVTIAAPTKAIAKACFDDGNSRVSKRQSNNNRRRTRGTNKRGTNKRGTNKRGTNKRGTNKRGTNKRGRRPNTRTRKTPPKPKPKTPSPENTRPRVLFPEEVTLETNWGEYMQRCDEYQEKHPEIKVIC